MCRGTGEIPDKWNPKPKKSFNPKKTGSVTMSGKDQFRHGMPEIEL
jgi:hypothetical protein